MNRNTDFLSSPLEQPDGFAQTDYPHDDNFPLFVCYLFQQFQTFKILMKSGEKMQENNIDIGIIDNSHKRDFKCRQRSPDGKGGKQIYRVRRRQPIGKNFRQFLFCLIRKFGNDDAAFFQQIAGKYSGAAAEVMIAARQGLGVRGIIASARPSSIIC